ncbi:MAG: Pyridoxal phosphate biosynthetic protein PdxJ [Planctomycetota bacterium]|nr:Pyridoxal phosphate biosynthetic protein PdxJ [Planctomycetota bacterium]
MTKLSVNVNKVATLRNTRLSGIPSVLKAAKICLDAGAHGITVHPRPDERHIRPADVHQLAELLKGYPKAEYNIEGNPFEGRYMDLVRAVRPTQCTLVPDDPDAFTSNQGWNLAKYADRLALVVASLRELGCRVSLFLDADPDQVAHAARVGAHRIELYTEPYAHAYDSGTAESGVHPFVDTAARAHELGLGVNAGHDLSRDNLPLFLGSVPGVLEVSIGHALISDALEMGYESAVRGYLAAIGF